MVASSEPSRSPARLRSQLEVAAGGGVDLHDVRLAPAGAAAQARQLAGLGQLDIVDERAGGGDLRAAEGAEAFEAPTP